LYVLTNTNFGVYLKTCNHYKKN